MQLFLAKEILKIISITLRDFLPMYSTTINASLNELYTSYVSITIVKDMKMLIMIKFFQSL